METDYKLNNDGFDSNNSLHNNSDPIIPQNGYKKVFDIQET